MHGGSYIPFKQVPQTCYKLCNHSTLSKLTPKHPTNRIQIPQVTRTLLSPCVCVILHVQLCHMQICVTTTTVQKATHSKPLSPIP